MSDRGISQLEPMGSVENGRGGLQTAEKAYRIMAGNKVDNEGKEDG